MALHNEGIIEHSGQEKELDAGAIDMLMDNLQISQYVYPVKSTLRESASNAVDSINEKLTAIAILSGSAKEEDFYYVPGKDKKMDAIIKSNPGVYKDSRFDPDYYDLEYLSPNNRVEIEYKQNDTKARDTLTIRDWGVGIADYRLKGYLGLGYSTKRLSKRPLGKWGLGAKSPLSMAPYYQLNSAHNGRLFQILIYSRHWQSIVPEKDLVTGLDNEFIHFYDKHGDVVTDGNGIPLKVYYKPWAGYNFSESVVECKKHHMEEVRNAVQSQLLYFDNVDFTITHSSGLLEQVEVMAPKLYEDGGLIVSENKYFSRPHIVINNVNYGYINTDELEIEPLKGNIGIKVAADEVNVTPNRENVIWDDTAVKVVLKRVKESAKAAKGIITASFQQEDFMEWLGACAGVFGFGNTVTETGPGIKALVQLQYIAKVRQDQAPSFTPDPEIRYYGWLPKMFPGLKIRKVTLETINRKKGNPTKKIEREEFTSTQGLFNLPIFAYSTIPTEQKDTYLLSQYPNGFLLVRDEVMVKSYFNERVKDASEAGMTQEHKDFLAQLSKEKGNEGTKANEYFIANLKRYEDVVVPPETKLISNDPTPEQIRRAEKRIVIQTPDSRNMWAKVEPKIGELDKIDKELYWGLNDDRDGLLLAAQICGNLTNNQRKEFNEERALLLGDKKETDRFTRGYMDHWAYPDTKVMLGLVSKENAHYLAEDHFHISEFFSRYHNGVLTMAEILINWNTARVMKSMTGEKLWFMSGMQPITPERYREYDEITQFITKYYKSTNSGTLESSIIEHLDRVSKLQTIIADDPEDTDTIAEVSRALFGAEIGVAKGIHLEWIERARDLLDWAEPIRRLLNECGHVSNMEVDSQDAVRDYVILKTGSL